MAKRTNPVTTLMILSGASMVSACTADLYQLKTHDADGRTRVSDMYAQTHKLFGTELHCRSLNPGGTPDPSQQVTAQTAPSGTVNSLGGGCEMGESALQGGLKTTAEVAGGLGSAAYGVSAVKGAFGSASGSIFGGTSGSGVPEQLNVTEIGKIVGRNTVGIGSSNGQYSGPGF